MKYSKNLIIISITFLIFSIIFYGKTGNMQIDFSREVYIPFQLNNGEKLIKDIFLIYGPFGYIINSLLYKLSTNINILLVEAHIISCFTVILFYLILTKFCKEKIALIFSIIFITISIFSNATFGFVTPYSYSSLWAYFGIYLVLFCLLYNKKNALFISLGLILSNRIELFVPIFIISIIYLLHKKEKFFKNLIWLFAIPLFSYGTLLFKNLNLNIIFQNIDYIIKMTKTYSIKALYKGVGCFYESHYFKYNLILSLKLALICAISYFTYTKNKKILSYIILIIGFCFLNLDFSLNLSGIFLIILGIVCTIKKKITSKEILLITFSLILCSKSLFAINSLSYSNFGFILLIFAIYLKLKEIVDKNWIATSMIIFFSLLFISKMIIFYYDFKTKVPTQIGNIWLNKNKAQLLIKTNDFISNNIRDDENFVVIPEGQIINLIHKKPHNFYNSTFTPLDFETFGDKNITEKLKNNKTDYVIFFARDTRDYGVQTMCYDYAVDFCKYVMDNYTKKETFGDIEKVKIYKIKK